MEYKKTILSMILVCCCFLGGCSLSFCGLKVGGREELVFTCGEETAAADGHMPEQQAEEQSGQQEEQQAEQQAETVSESTAGKVNLNTAGIEELQTIKGIGETRARAILEYRSEHGSFAQPEDIMQVPGIKEGIFSKIKDQITVQ